jgi:hypothetical protein
MGATRRKKMRGSGTVKRVKKKLTPTPKFPKNIYRLPFSRFPNGTKLFSQTTNEPTRKNILTAKRTRNILKHLSMFRDKNVQTLQVRNGQLGMMNALGVFQKTHIVYCRGHGNVVGTFKCPDQTAVINTGKTDRLTETILSVMAPAIMKLLFRGNPDKTAIDNFKNFLTLKSGYSSSYGPDALINSVSYTTPGTTMKNVRLTKKEYNSTDMFNPYRGIWDITEAVKQNSLRVNDVTDEEYELPLGDIKTSTLAQIISLIGAAITGGPARSDITNMPRKYIPIPHLTSKMVVNMASVDYDGITTEEILNELRIMPEYKDSIIFLIVFACGSWGPEVYKPEVRDAITSRAGPETNFAVPSEHDEEEPDAPPALPGGVGTSVFGNPIPSFDIEEEEED